MKIEISTDWQEVHRLLKAEMTTIGYNSDFYKMLKNIDSMVSELSKIEVVARRTRSTVLHMEHITKINQAIDHLSKVLIMAKLMR
jgi:hypothetical protein